MKIVVAGGTGFIGRNLVRQLVRDGHEVTVLIRDHKSPAPGHFPPNARLTPYYERPTQTDAVINFAGEPVAGRWTSHRKKAIMDSRVDVTRELVDWMGSLKTKPSVFLSGSAVGFYGDHGVDPITEHDGPDPARKFRAQVCILWEQEANRARSLGIRVVNLRTGNVLDPTGGMLGKMTPLLRLAPFIAPFNSRGYLPWISMRDTVGAVEFLLTQKELSGPVNITSPGAATSGDLFRGLGPIIHRKVIGKIPSFAIKLALGEFSEALLDSQKVLPEKLVHAGYVFQDPDLGEFLRAQRSALQKGKSKRPVK